MRLLALSILSVGIVTAILVWGCLHVIRDVERMHRDPRFLRRRLMFMAIIYIAGSIFGILQVATGGEPPITLIGLPIAAALAWLFIKQAANVKIPPPKP